MEIRIRSTGAVVNEHEFVRHVRDQGLQQDPPVDINLPAILTTDLIIEHGGEPVLEAPTPDVTEYQSAQRSGVVKDTLGNWVYAWAVRDWTPEEIEDAKARRREALQQQIDALERAALLNRGSRELELRLMEKEADAMAASMSTPEAPVTRDMVLATVPYYAKVKTLDDQITALRVAMGAIV